MEKSEPPPKYSGPPVMQQPTVPAINGGTCMYRDVPCRIQCQLCGNVVTTNMEYQAGVGTWVAAGGLCFFGCVLGCCLIPFCVNACKDVVHTCPNCQAVVGRYNRL